MLHERTSEEAEWPLFPSTLQKTFPSDEVSVMKATVLRF